MGLFGGINAVNEINSLIAQIEKHECFSSYDRIEWDEAYHTI